jgi:TatD DNase family protein
LETVKNCPLERILSETDAPYLSPVPYRGKRNEPAYVKYIIAKIAEIKNIGLESAANQLVKNAENLFNVKI